MQNNSDGNTEYVNSKPSTSPSCTTLSSIETPIRTTFLGSVGKTTIALQNRFSALSSDEDEECNVATSQLTMDFHSRGRWRKAPPVMEMGSCEAQEVNNVLQQDYIEITVDSGASENVMLKHMAPGTPVEHSEEQDKGTLYVAANGDLMPNRGKKNVPILMKEGQQRKINMQITDVNRALPSVAKVCDAGHTVTFTSKGGTIHNLETVRDRNVYRLRVSVTGDSRPPLRKDFQRQG